MTINQGKVIDTFEIPDELASELDNLLLEYQFISEQHMRSTDASKLENYSKDAISLLRKINNLKFKITSEYVPLKYQSDKYSWNYEGYDVATNIVQILSN